MAKFITKRKVINFSNTSRGIILPKIFCDAYGIDVGGEVTIEAVEEGILIKLK